MTGTPAGVGDLNIGDCVSIVCVISHRVNLWWFNYIVSTHFRLQIKRIIIFVSYYVHMQDIYYS
jgi:hypothetical protein